jgi:hypothetical protein
MQQPRPRLGLMFGGFAEPWSLILSLIRPMKFRFIFLSVLGIMEASAGAKKPARMLMHTFQDGSAIIFVAIVDDTPAARGVVRASDPSRQRTFTVSRQHFDEMWRTLESVPQKYAGGEGASRTFDAASNLIFSTGYMPDGKKIIYVIPKNSAFQPLVALARQLEAYAH